MSQWEKILKIDPRVIYLVMLLAVALPLIRPIGLPMAIVDTTVQAYEEIDKLQPGSRVFMSFDCSPGGAAELEPVAYAVLAHFLEKDIKVYGTTSVPEAISLTNRGLEFYEKDGRDYGKDYVNLGYFAGGENAVAALSENFRSVFTSDINGTPIDQIDMMREVKNMNDMDMVVSINSGPGGNATVDVWVRQVAVVYDVPVILAVTAVQEPSTMPYLQSKQIKGLLGGLRPGAEYEMLLDRPGHAVAMMDAQSIAHIAILVFILLGNIAYFATKSRTNEV